MNSHLDTYIYSLTTHFNFCAVGHILLKFVVTDPFIHIYIYIQHDVLFSFFSREDLIRFNYGFFYRLSVKL